MRYPRSAFPRKLVRLNLQIEEAVFTVTSTIIESKFKGKKLGKGDYVSPILQVVRTWFLVLRIKLNITGFYQASATG